MHSASQVKGQSKEATGNIGLKQVSKDIMAGVTVSLALVPASVAFAFMAGVQPSFGLYCSVIVGLISAVMGGRPGMITAATSALAVVMVSLVVEYGEGYLLAATMLMGVFQIAAGFLHLGKFIRLVPTPAIYGFVNGLAIVIFLSQLDHFKVRLPDGTMSWIGGMELYYTVGLALLTMLVIQFFPRITKAIPASLVGVIAVSSLAIGLGIEVKTVGDVMLIDNNLPVPKLPEIEWSWQALEVITSYALIFAAIGLIESLITMSLVDDITHTHGRGNRECIGQGLGNFFAGLCGGFGGCATVGPTMINLKSGGRGRLSGVTAALCLLAFILFGQDLIKAVPIAALVGLMFMVVIATFAWSTFRIIRKIPRSDAFVLLAVTVITVVEDLALAVLIGVILSALAFAWEHAKNTHVRIFLTKGKKVYKVYGPLFFGSVKSFTAFFEPQTDPAEVIIDFKNSRVCDHSAIEAIDNLAEKYIDAGINLHLLHLSPECKQLLAKGAEYVEIDKEVDPTYHVATDRLD